MSEIEERLRGLALDDMENVNGSDEPAKTLWQGADEIARLRAENERLRGLLREVWKWGFNGRLRGDLVIRIERNRAPVAAGSEGTASVVASAHDPEP